MKTKPEKKFKGKEKIAMAIFMNCVPQIIDLWKRSKSYPETPFDVFLMDIYNSHKERSK